MVIRITSSVEVSIQAVSPESTLGAGAAGAAGAAAASAAGAGQRRLRELRAAAASAAGAAAAGLRRRARWRQAPGPWTGCPWSADRAPE